MAAAYGSLEYTELEVRAAKAKERAEVLRKECSIWSRQLKRINNIVDNNTHLSVEESHEMLKESLKVMEQTLSIEILNDEGWLEKRMEISRPFIEKWDSQA